MLFLQADPFDPGSGEQPDNVPAHLSRHRGETARNSMRVRVRR